MNERQSIAFLLPCARAWETLRPEFTRLVEYKGRTWSTILSVNK